MRRNPLLLSLLLAGGVISGIRADTITLKSGDKLEGKIRSETETEVVIEYKVSSGIADERTIPREEIASMEKSSPDEAAFLQIKSLKPDPQSSLPSEDYDEIIAALKNFQNAFPNSPHSSEVQLDLDEFEREQARVSQGDVKYLGQWISSEEAAKRKIQIEGQQLFGVMKQRAAAGHLADAMATFEQIEKGYSGTRIFPDAVDLARSLVAQMRVNLPKRAALATYNQAQFKHTLAMTAEPQRSQLAARVKAEQDAANAAVAAASKSGAKWTPLFPNNLNSITTLQKTVATEGPRLAGIKTADMRESISRMDEAKKAWAAKDFAAADSLIHEAQQLWGQNEEMAFYSAELAALKNPQSKSARTPYVTPAPFTPGIVPGAFTTPAKASTPKPGVPPPSIAASTAKPSAKPGIGATSSPLPSPSATATGSVTANNPTPSATSAAATSASAPSQNTTSASATPGASASHGNSSAAQSPTAARSNARTTLPPAMQPTLKKAMFLMTIPGALTLLALSVIIAIVAEVVTRIKAAKNIEE
jgi:hypothetical protein